MRTELPRNVEDSPKQIKAINKASDLKGHLKLLGENFNDTFWPTYVTDYSNPRNLSPEDFKFRSFIAKLCGQLAFPSVDGQLFRSKSQKWRRSPFDAMHQLALGIYVAKLNLQAIPLRNELISQVGNTPAAFGVYGIFLEPRNGVIQPYNEDRDGPIYETARDRLSEKRKISLPDEPLNDAMAAIEFTEMDAERMSITEFQSKVLESVVTATKGWVDPIPVFTAPPTSYEKRSFWNNFKIW